MTLIPDAGYAEVLETPLGDLVLVPWQRPASASQRPIGAVLSRLAPQFDDAHVLLTIKAEDALPVHADPYRITQVLTNIIGNALAATPAGGTVTVLTRAQAAGPKRWP